MVLLKSFSNESKSIKEIDANEKIFGLKANPTLVWQAENWFMACQRQGTASTKTRAEVRGGGKKPWKQKGTGRARAGSSRSPVWVGGGVTFGPKPRDYSYAFPKKMRTLAIKTVLSDKAREGKVLVFDRLQLPQKKTKEMVKLLNEAKITGKALVVIQKQDEDNLKLAARNISGVNMVNSAEMNIHDLLGNDWVVLTKDSLADIEGRLK